MNSKQTTRREFLKKTCITTFGMGLWGTISCNIKKTKKRPNILLIMADDMGFSDAGCYGGEIDTPNLDQLAEDGLRFKQFYNCARCCPTRASLMTGVYPHEVGLGLNGRTLSKNSVTIAEMMKQANYDTMMVGKWHLSQTQPLNNKTKHLAWLNHRYEPNRPFAPIGSYPVNRGFDKYYGSIWGVINHFDPFSLVEGSQKIENISDDYYFTDAITDKLLEYLKRQENSNKPWFTYYAHCAPHWPLHALEKDIEKYMGKYSEGWDRLREGRFKRQLDMGLYSDQETILPEVQDRDQEWENLSSKQKGFQSAKMAVHAAMVDRIDQNLGRVIKYLKTTGQFKNTLIMFLSDNGSSPETPVRPGYDRPSKTREGEKIQYAQDIMKGKKPDLPGSEKTYAGIGPGWASATNTPFRFWKKESFEGGVHTPLIIHWPKGLKTKNGSYTHQVGHVMDVMPTCLELAGIDYPNNYKSRSIPQLRGKSLLPILKGENRDGHRVIYFEHEGGRAIRVGDWKLVALLAGGWELYNLADDKAEMVNLIEKYPDKAREMRQMWVNWAKKVDVPAPPNWRINRLKQENRLNEIPKVYRDKID